MEAAGLASAIFTFLDITAKIVTRTREFLNQAENAPAFLKSIETRLPVLEDSLQLVDEEIRLQHVSADLQLKVRKVVEAAVVELKQLDSYIAALSSQNVSSKLQKIDRAIKSVLIYEGRINQTLEKLDGFTDTLVLLQISIVTGRTGRTEENTLRVLKTLEDDKSAVEAQREKNDILVWLDGMPRDNCTETCLMRKSALSCVWIFENQAYISWQSKTFSHSPSRFLWIHGPAGCGKTFLAANMFDCFEQQPIEAAAVFWRSGGIFEDATLDEVPRSWVQQLLSKHHKYYEYIKPIWMRSRSCRASPQEVWDALKSILTSPTAAGITLFLDGLDVYQEQQAKRARSSHPGSYQTLQHTSIRDFLWTLKDTLEGQDCRFVCFSQPDSDIQSQLSPSQIARANFQFHIEAWEHSISANDIREDLHQVAFDMIKERLPKKKYDFWLDLSHLIADQAESYLSMEIMQREISNLKPTYSEKKLRRMLEQSPIYLQDFYQTDIDRIMRLPLEDQWRACRMLQWVAYAVRPLSVQELLEAILIEHDLEDFPEDDLPEDLDDEAVYGEIKELCGSFIAFDVGDYHDQPRSWKVRLVHPSAKDFLVQNLNIAQHVHPSSSYTASHADRSLGSLCIRYLMYENIWPSAGMHNESASPATIASHPLLAYVATYFHHHIQICAAEERRDIENLLREFLDEHFHKFSTWHQNRRHDCSRAGMDIQPSWDWSNRLAFTAAVGLLDVVRQLTASDKANSSELSQALCAACWSSSIEMVHTLLGERAEVNLLSPYGSGPLHIAAFFGQSGVVTQLFQNGANPNLVTDRGDTALHQAVEGGHEEVVQVLLSHGADATIAKSVDGCLPIHVAAQSRNLRCMKTLLGTHSDVSKTINATTYQGWSALGIAVSHLDHETDREIVKALLSNGGNPLQMYSDDRDPFFICAEHGNQVLFDVLQQHTGELRPAANNTIYAEGQSLLHAAVLGQSCDIVESVLEAGINCTHQNNNGQTALDLAEPLSLDVTASIAMYLAKSRDGMAFLANRLIASPPEDPELSEEYLIIMHKSCLRGNADMPEVLVKHLETCPSERHKMTEEVVKSWLAAEARELVQLDHQL